MQVQRDAFSPVGNRSGHARVCGKAREKRGLTRRWLVDGGGTA